MRQLEGAIIACEEMLKEIKPNEDGKNNNI